MPFLHQHAARLQDPKKFDPESFRRNDSPVFGKKLPPGVEVIWAKFIGKAADADPVIPQAIRFPDDKYTEAQAKKWLADNNIKYILFEPAEKVKEEFKLEDWDAQIIGKEQTSELIKRLDSIKNIFITRESNPQEELIANAYIILTEELKYRRIGFRLVDELEDMLEKLRDTELEEGIRAAFGSPGGKRFLAKMICSYIPDHKIYVEPFAGGAAVFFAKKISEQEILNDKNPEIAFSYKFMKEGDLGSLSKHNWVINEEYFKKLKDSIPKSDADRFHKFAYLRLCSYGCDETGTVDKGNIGKERHIMERLPKIKERLAGAKIYNRDYTDLLKEFDSTETFFYLDPPYTGDKTDKFKSNIDWDIMREQLKSIKGKFILSCHTEIKEKFKGFDIKEIEVIRTMDMGNTGRTKDHELLISNFPLKESTNWLREEDSILQEKTGKFTLRFHWWMDGKQPAEDSRFELLLDTGKESLDRWDFSGEFFGNPLKKSETNAVRKVVNIQTPNGEPFQKYLEWEGSISPKNAQLTKTKIIDKAAEVDNAWVVGEPMENEIVTKPTFAEFKPGQEVWIDQWQNIYTGPKGGAPYGNATEQTPVYIDIEDFGTVEVLEETEQFISFKFNGKLLNDFWIMRKEDMKQPWIFSKGKLQQNEINEFHSNETPVPEFGIVDVSESSFPLKVQYRSSTYKLILTGNQKLRLEKP